MTTATRQFVNYTKSTCRPTHGRAYFGINYIAYIILSWLEALKLHETKTRILAMPRLKVEYEAATEQGNKKRMKIHFHSISSHLFDPCALFLVPHFRSMRSEMAPAAADEQRQQTTTTERQAAAAATTTVLNNEQQSGRRRR